MPQPQILYSQLIEKLFIWLRISTKPVIRVYDGYGDKGEIIIYGHVLKVSPVERKNYTQNVFLNFIGLIRLFIVVPIKDAHVEIEWNGELHKVKTEADGFFKFDWVPKNKQIPGWHPAKVSYISNSSKAHVLAQGFCTVFIPHEYQYNFISDIDDTFLISHSRNLRKRLYVLFTKNARSRKPFEGVVKHYQLLSQSGKNGIPNPFFYVSSSEWNLYYYIKEFCRKEKMPRGIFLLNQIKRFKDLLNTGQGKHTGKYTRIVRILKAYPHHKYVLLGDNSQSDPEIYHSIVKDFPGKIFAVYIRNVSKVKEKETAEFFDKIKKTETHCCYFVHSSEAIEHSVKIGLIDPALI
ncbi:MAG: DUF2183 domain-containing protein [Bacteroidetes bacterium]|nr:DUF2183 domain-containing protein [Bacteroidota bacterium]